MTTEDATAGQLDAKNVAKYLRDHLEFFSDYPELLESIRLPHQRGSSISLVERQLEVLRERSQHLEGQLKQLIDVARNNETLSRQMHAMAVELLHIDSIEDLVASMSDNLQRHFGAEEVCVILIGEQDVQAPALRWMAHYSAELAPFKGLIERGRVVCGRGNSTQLSIIFAEQAEQIQSTAMIPLVSGRNMGLLIVGSRDANRYSADKGAMFLEQFGALTSAALVRLLSN